MKQLPWSNRNINWIPTLPLMLFALLLSSCSGVTAARAKPDGYPRIGAYVGVRSGGAPLIKADGTVDSAVCKQFARFPQVAVDLNALLISPNVVPTLLHYRPEIEIAGYHLTTHWYLKPDFPVQAGDKTFDAYWHRTIVSTNGFIVGASEGYEVNWGQKGTSEELTKLLVWGLQRLRVRAWFGDYFSPMVAWAGVGNEWSDQTRIRNMSVAVSTIREAMPYGFRAYGNGTGAEKCGLNGTLMEGFPTPFTNFQKALTQKEGDWLKCEGTLADKRALRFMLGTACLTGATTTYGAQEVAPGGQPWPGTWWFDEYSVDPAGRPDPTGRCVGWLGEALGGWVRFANGLYMRFFEHGVVVVNPTSSLVTQQALSLRWKRIGSNTPDSVLSVPAQDALFLWGE